MSLFTILPITVADDTLPTIPSGDVEFFGEGELAAYGHWLLAGDSSSLQDVVNSRLLTLQNASYPPTYNDSYITLDISSGKALQSSRYEGAVTDAYTMVMVYRTSLDGTAAVIPWGTLGVTASNYGGSTYLANDGSNHRVLHTYRGAASSIDTGLRPAIGDWTFIAVSVQYTNNTAMTFHTVVDGNTNSVGPGSATYIPNPSDPLALGNQIYTGGASGAFDCAEFMIFDGALDTASMLGIYNRSKVRMSRRGITI